MSGYDFLSSIKTFFVYTSYEHTALKFCCFKGTLNYKDLKLKLPSADLTMHILLLGFYIRFSCSLIKWNLQRANNNDYPLSTPPPDPIHSLPTSNPIYLFINNIPLFFRVTLNRSQKLILGFMRLRHSSSHHKSLSIFLSICLFIF